MACVVLPVLQDKSLQELLYTTTRCLRPPPSKCIETPPYYQVR